MIVGAFVKEASVLVAEFDDNVWLTISDYSDPHQILYLA